MGVVYLSMEQNRECKSSAYWGMDYSWQPGILTVTKSVETERKFTKEEIRDQRIEGAKELFTEALIGFVVLILHILQAACFGLGIALLIGSL